jgi:large subunit ribosomal protein L9
MNKELILLEDVDGLGKIGDVVKVAPGYARNYLLPRGKAEIINKGTLRQVEARKLKKQQEHAARIEVAKTMAAKIEALNLVIPMAVGENDKLFGSVSAQMIADLINDNGIEIEKNIVALDENLRDLGEYQVAIKLNPEVVAQVKVQIVKKDAE